MPDSVYAKTPIGAAVGPDAYAGAGSTTLIQLGLAAGKLVTVLGQPFVTRVPVKTPVAVLYVRPVRFTKLLELLEQVPTVGQAVEDTAARPGKSARASTTAALQPITLASSEGTNGLAASPGACALRQPRGRRGGQGPRLGVEKRQTGRSNPRHGTERRRSLAAEQGIAPARSSRNRLQMLVAERGVSRTLQRLFLRTLVLTSHWLTTPLHHVTCSLGHY